MAGEFLPPVVTRLEGDLENLAAIVAKARTLIKSLNTAVDIEVKTSGISGPIRGAVAQVEALKTALKDLPDSKTVRIGVDGLGAAAGARAGLGLGGFFLGGLRLTAGALHWIIAGFAELAAVVIPATIAIAAWAAVWIQGTQNVQQHVQAVYATAESLANMGGKTAGQMLGLGNALQKAQNAANPQVYQALGASIDLVKEHAGGLTQAGLKLGSTFDTFMAKVVTDFSKGGSLSGPLNNLTRNMVSDATQIGQVFGNAGHVLLSFGGQMPGLAELLLHALSGITGLAAGVIDFAGKLSIGRWSVITFALAFEEFNRWGSLATRGMSAMGLGTVALEGNFFSLTRAAGILKNVFGLIPRLFVQAGVGISNLSQFMPVGAARMQEFGHEVSAVANEASVAVAGLSTAATITAAVGTAAIVGMLVYLSTASTQAQRLASSLQRVADEASNANVLNVLGNNYSQLTASLHGTQGSLAGLTHLMHVNLEAARVLGGVQGYLRSEISQTNTALGSTSQQFVTVAAHAAVLAHTYGTSLYGALVLADLAGVKLNQTISPQNWALAQLKIASLVQGFQSMGAGIGAAANDVYMLGIQSGLAATQVGKVNQAGDQFIQNLTGGTSGLVSFNQSLHNMGSAIGHVQNNLGQFTGRFSLSQQQFANSLNSFTGKGAQAWINFDQVVGSTAPQIIDWFRTAGAEGAISGTKFRQGMLAMLSGLVPLASKSKIAQAELLGLAHDAGLNAKTFPDLVQQIRNGHVSAAQLAQIIGQATAKMGDMAAVAQRLGTVLQSTLIQTMDAARIASSGVAKATLQYEQSIMNAGAAANATNPKFNAVVTDLEKLGYSGSQARKTIDALGRSIVNLPTAHTTTFYLRTVGSVPSGSGLTGGVNHVGAFASGTRSAPPGWAVVGEGGPGSTPELVRFRGGEQVVSNRELSSSPSRGGGSSVTEIRLFLDGREIFPAMQQRTFEYNHDNGNRDSRGRVRGVLVPR